MPWRRKFKEKWAYYVTEKGSRASSPNPTAEDPASKASSINHGDSHSVHESISSSVPAAVGPDPSDESQQPASNEAPLTTVPIRELWSVAYKNLQKEDESLVKEYEKKLCGNMTAGLGSMLGLPVQERMAMVLQYKMNDVNRDTWKVKFGSTEVQVREIVQPVLGVVDWVNENLGDALSENTCTSIPWAGVSLLLPLLLNPSEQNSSLANGLEYMSSLIAQSRMR